MVLEIEEQSPAERPGTIPWIFGGIIASSRRQLIVAAGALALAWPVLLVTMVTAPALPYGWFAVFLWGVITAVQGSSLLRKYSLKLNWEDFEDGGRVGSGPTSSSVKLTVYALLLGGISSFLTVTVIVAELVGPIVGPLGVLFAVILVKGGESLMNNRGYSMAAPGVEIAQKLLTVTKRSSRQRRLIAVTSDDLDDFFESGLLAFWSTP